MPHPQIKIVGETPDGNIRAIAVNFDGSLPIAVGPALASDGNGIGNKADPVSDITNLYPQFPDVGEPIPGEPYSVISLLKGIFEKTHLFIGGILTTKEKNNDFIIDSSGTIFPALTSVQLFSDFSPVISYLFIQNLVIPNIPSGNLWVNFGSESVVGASSIQIRSGEYLELTRGSLLGQTVHLLGEIEGQAYTAKIGVSA